MGRAIEYEVKRQIRLYEKGETVKQATLGWDEASQKIVIQRYKERADEYRYFPEPDLPIVEVSREWVDEVRARIPELPEAKQQRFMAELGLSDYDAAQLVAEKSIADFYEGALASRGGCQSSGQLDHGQSVRADERHEVSREDIDHIQITPAAVRRAGSNWSSDGTLNKGTAAAVLDEMWATGKDPAQIVEDTRAGAGLRQRA